MPGSIFSQVFGNFFIVLIVTRKNKVGNPAAIEGQSSKQTHSKDK